MCLVWNYILTHVFCHVDILEGSKQLYASRKIRKLLEIVLALGNYMNKGNRGNAFGFKISSLNKIQDTKSSQDRDITMLNYLVELFDKQVRLMAWHRCDCLPVVASLPFPTSIPVQNLSIVVAHTKYTFF